MRCSERRQAIAAVGEGTVTTDQPQPTAKPRRFRFGLRTLLAVVTLAAVGSWGYWVAWPWWQAYREQVNFEAAASQLRIGENIPIDKQFGTIKGNDTLTTIKDGANLVSEVGKYIRSNASYCIIWTIRITPNPLNGGWEYVKVSVYRLQHAPVDYRPYRDHENSPYYTPSSSWLRDIKYLDDFADFILGDTQDGRRYQYELIYSDPPAKPNVK